MKETLVIGLYEDTGQTFTSITKTTDNSVALRQAAQEAGPAADQLILLGTVRAKYNGGLEFTPAIDMYNGAAYAEEFRGGGDDDSSA